MAKFFNYESRGTERVFWFGAEKTISVNTDLGAKRLFGYEYYEMGNHGPVRWSGPRPEGLRV